MRATLRMKQERTKMSKKEETTMVNETESEYQIDRAMYGNDWKSDEEVFATTSRKNMNPITECGHESWLVDSCATTHVFTSTNMMFNIKETREGEHVRVGNNETLKATAIGDLAMEQKKTKKTLQLRNVMVVPQFAQNLISVGRLIEKGNEFVSSKEETKLINRSGEIMKFEKGTDGMAYFIAKQKNSEEKVYNATRIIGNDEEIMKKKRKETMGINEAHRKFGHATEKVIRKILHILEIIPTGTMSVCDGCA